MASKRQVRDRQFVLSCALQALLLALVHLLIGCSGGGETQGGSRDYTQWRGPHRNGSASAFVQPGQWPEQLERKWKTHVGQGYATPLVIGDIAFSFVRREAREVVTALDARTGEDLWYSGYAETYAPGGPALAHGAGPKATPVYCDGRLFTLGISGIVAAFDVASGDLLWRTDVPDEPPFFGAASSPLAGEGIVVAHPGNYGPLTAFDALTGKIVWTAGQGGFFASPILAELAGTRQVVTVTTDGVIGVSFPNGDLLWRHPWNGGTGGPTPVLHGNTVIVSGRNLGTAAFNVIQAQGAWTTEIAWETSEVSMYVSTPVVIDSTLFGLSHRARGQYFALDARTGGVLWLGPPRAAHNTAVVKAGNLLFLLNDDAELIVSASSEAKFDEVGRYSVADSATWAQPAISGSRLFVKDVDSLALWTVE